VQQLLGLSEPALQLAALRELVVLFFSLVHDVTNPYY
jgi:hypothetical protein